MADLPVIRLGLRAILASAGDIQVCGEAGSGAQALELLGNLAPDVVVMDCQMPDMNGARLAEAICLRDANVKILGFGSTMEEILVGRPLDAGATGYLLKSAPPEIIVEAVRATGRGVPWLSPRVARSILARARRALDEEPDLTRREREVLGLLANGWSNARIAQVLVITVGTVKSHVARIYAKLGIHTRAGAVAWAWEHGLVGGGEGHSPVE